MSDIELYRQTKATEITAIYNASIFKQYTNINKNILLEVNSSNTQMQKQEQISLYIKQLYSNSKSIQNNFQADISNVPLLLPIAIIDPSNLLPKKGLLFGINYINTPLELQGCWNDVNDVSTRLTQKGFTNITMITDELTSTIKPTRANILSNITNFLASGNEGDILFLMYSGHGVYLTDYNLDEIDSNDEQIVSLDFRFISDDNLKKIIMDNLKQNVTLIAVFDSCYSGSILDLKYIYLDNANNNTTSINNKTSETIGNVILISGATDSQVAADSNKTGRNGAMTWALLETLKNNSNITWRNLILNMRSLLANSDYTQIPQLSSGKFIDIDKPILI